MRVLLHVGPHKTGTTSVQLAFLDTYGSLNPNNYWYPAPDDFGPGHAKLAWELIGLNGFAQNDEAVKSILQSAATEGATAVLLSSEEFSRAYPRSWTTISKALEDHQVNVLVTLTAVANRCASWWQELVKHCHVKEFESSREEVFQHAGLRPNFVETIVGGLRPSSLTVLILSPNENDNHLFLNVAKILVKACGDDCMLNRKIAMVNMSTNKSLGFYECACMLLFNKEYIHRNIRTDYILLRDVLFDSFKTAAWRSLFPFLRLQTPNAFLSDLESLASQTIASLRTLEKAGKVTILGQLDDLARNNILREHQQVPALNGEQIEYLNAVVHSVLTGR